MKYFFIYFLLTVLPLYGEVISYGDEYIRYDVPEDWLRKTSVRTDFREYFLWDDSESKLFVQLHRNRKWAQWHLRGLPDKLEVFAKYWQEEGGLYETGDLVKINYDPESYVLSMHWKKKDGSLLLSKMKLTSFGCLAFHKQLGLDESEAASEKELDQLVDSIVLPDRLKFYPEDLVSEIVNNMGGAVIFIVVSLMYLMFSLFQRSNLHQRRMEMRLQANRPTSRLDFD